MPRESMQYDVVVVGAGPAGLAAAIRLKQLGGALLEAQGRGEAGGTRADDHHVVLHRFARHRAQL